jgi:hypothetical protein
VQAREVVHKLDNARNYTLSSADISRIVQEKREKGLVKRSLAMQKAELTLARNAAAEIGDAHAEAKCGPLCGHCARAHVTFYHCSDHVS